MTPIEFKNFCNTNRDAFFAKYPKPGKGPRGFWKNAVQHADNALECGGIAGAYDPATFDNAAAQIKKWLAA